MKAVYSLANAACFWALWHLVGFFIFTQGLTLGPDFFCTWQQFIELVKIIIKFKSLLWNSAKYFHIFALLELELRYDFEGTNSDALDKNHEKGCSYTMP